MARNYVKERLKRCARRYLEPACAQSMQSGLAQSRAHDYPYFLISTIHISALMTFIYAVRRFQSRKTCADHGNCRQPARVGCKKCPKVVSVKLREFSQRESARLTSLSRGSAHARCRVGCRRRNTGNTRERESVRGALNSERHGAFFSRALLPPFHESRETLSKGQHTESLTVKQSSNEEDPSRGSLSHC